MKMVARVHPLLGGEEIEECISFNVRENVITINEAELKGTQMMSAVTT